MAKHGLGKGLRALMPQDDELPLSSGVPPVEGGALPNSSQKNNSSGGVNIPLDKLKANPGQPRKNFDEEALKELADSIRENGVIQPIIAEDAGDGSYIIVAGERRTRAARLAGLTEIPAILRNYTEEKRMEVALIENVQRSDLNPIEEAAAYKKIMELTGLSQDAVAVRVGKNRSTVANALRLLKLPAEIQKALEEGVLSAGHARAILSTANRSSQGILFKEIIAKGLSVRDAEKKAAFLNEKKAELGVSPDPAVIPVVKKDPEIIAMEEKFIERFGTKVVIDGSMESGRIRIDYYSMDDLGRLYEILGGETN
ncbi:chromosome partitioning protein ParB [Spirochaetia bacterium]|nr:chromosome partitioning protein ParB [Spirochaetia bacterium]